MYVCTYVCMHACMHVYTKLKNKYHINGRHNTAMSGNELENKKM